VTAWRGVQPTAAPAAAGNRRHGPIHAFRPATRVEPSPLRGRIVRIPRVWAPVAVPGSQRDNLREQKFARLPVMTTKLARTPLADWHESNGGRMVDFAGWSMPVQYTSIVAEHTATRQAVGMFDISHMGRLRFDGAGAGAFLDSVVTRRVVDAPVGRIRYALVTNDRGGILDDVLVYHLADNTGKSYWLMVVNAGNRAKIVDWLTPRLAKASDVRMTDATRDWAMIAVQGPRAIEFMEPLVDADLPLMKYYTATETMIDGFAGILSRTGYTGEDGCEVILGAHAARRLWESLIEQGSEVDIMPAGLGCRDTLRLEAGMPLYGHELSEEIDPFEADLAFAVDLEGRTFPGCDVLAQRQHHVPRKRVGLQLGGKRVPREGFPIVAQGRPVGLVTSGTFSPTFNRPLAMGYVETPLAEVGTRLAIDIRGAQEPAEVVRLPFYKRHP
jgi:aminomethyltransferase